MPTNPDLDALCERLERDYTSTNEADAETMREASTTIRSLREQVKVAKLEGMLEAAEIVNTFAGNRSFPCMSALSQIAAAIRARIKESRDA